MTDELIRRLRRHGYTAADAVLLDLGYCDREEVLRQVNEGIDARLGEECAGVAGE